MQKIDNFDKDSVMKSPELQVLSKSPILRFIYIILAILSLIVGLIGIVIPGLPCTEFILLAAFFASKGSTRLYLWFYHHRTFGSMIQNWQQHRRIKRRTKCLSALSMLIASALLIWRVDHLPSVVISIACMCVVSVWIWSRPEIKNMK